MASYHPEKDPALGAGKIADRKHLALLQQLSVWLEKGSCLLNAKEKHEVALSALCAVLKEQKQGSKCCRDIVFLQ